MTKINRNIKRIKNREMREYGLKSPHVSCLYFLYLFGGLTATELCEKCEEDKATVSRSLGFLEQKGFVRCREQGKKRYNSPMELTAHGREAAKKIADKIDSVVENVGEDLSEGEREVFYRFLNKVSDKLEKAAADERM